MAVRPAPQRPGRALQPEAVPAPRPHLRVVPPNFLTAKARRRRARRLFVLGGALAAAGMFSVVAFHVVLTQSQLDIQRLEARAQTASVRQQQLRLETARLESPERVVHDAERMGMVPPATVRYLTPASEQGAKPVPTTTAPKPRPTTQATTPASRPATSAPRATTATTVPKTTLKTTPKVTAPKTTTAPARPAPTTVPGRVTR
jgi:hypothetical protein